LRLILGSVKFVFISKKSAYHHGDLRQALVAAAAAILEKGGPHAVTLRAVAKRVGVSQAAPYHHFADKEAILAAVAEEGFAQLAVFMDDARAVAGSSPGARLRATGLGYVRFATRHPSHFQLMFAGILPVANYPSLFEVSLRSFGILMESVVAAQEAGLLRKGAPVELAVLGWSMVHGLAMLHVSGVMNNPGGPVGPIDGLAEAAVDAIARGLGSRPDGDGDPG
jgi:AcrR family transcriptional regulator